MMTNTMVARANKDRRRKPVGTIEVDKVTLKATVIASGISALILFIITTLWMHQGDIVLLKTNQAAVMKQIEGYDEVPKQLVRIETLMEQNNKDHISIMKRLDRR